MEDKGNGAQWGGLGRQRISDGHSEGAGHSEGTRLSGNEGSVRRRAMG